MSKPLNMNIGGKLKTLRKGRKMTQVELANELGITRASVCNYELGRRCPHLSELKRIAEYFGVGLEYFGVEATDDLFELIARAKEIFNSPEVPKETKEELYKALMRIYLDMK